jgi:hypothetical protein
MKEELGDRWLQPRSSASAPALLTDIERQLEHFVTGRYSAPIATDGLSPMAERRLPSDRRLVGERAIFESHGATARSREPTRRCAHGSKRARHRFGHYIGGRWAPPHRGDTFEVLEARHGQALAAVAQGTPPTWTPPWPAARAALPAWQALDGRTARARYLYASRAACRSTRATSPCSNRSTTASRSARRAISTSRSSRVTSTTTPAGRSCWTASSRATGRGRGGADHPVELPAAHAGVEGRAGARGGNTVVLKPAEFTPLTALRFAELCTRSGFPAGVSTRHRRRPAPARRSSRTRDVDKIAFTGSTEVGRPSARRRPAAASAVARAGRQEPVPRLRRRRSRQRRRRCRRCHLVQPGAGVLRRARACWSRRASPIALERQAPRPHGDAARGRSARQGGGHGRDRGAGAARAHRRSSSRAWPKGATCWQPSGASREDGWFTRPRCSPTCAREHHRAGRDLRAGAGDA